jgi:hypothetical protein
VGVSEDTPLGYDLDGTKADVKPTMDPDPTPGEGPRKVPTYALPRNVVAGDVILYEDKIGGIRSDVIRFPNTGNGVANTLLFYSELDLGGMADSAIADVGLPVTTLSLRRNLSKRVKRERQTGSNILQRPGSPDSYRTSTLRTLLLAISRNPPPGYLLRLV